VSSGTIHAATSIAAGVGLVAVGHYDLTPAAMLAATFAGGVLPDIDRGTSLAGGLIPRGLAPDVNMPVAHRMSTGVPSVGEPFGVATVYHGRKFGPFLLPHRGPTHSLIVWLVLSMLVGLLSWRCGVALYLGAFLHIVVFDRSGQWFWPLSLRWAGRRRRG
jgi:LexA-binding, inner membrane-associated putative hydrolase